MIKEATVDELPKLLHLAEKFYACSNFLDGWNAEVWLRNWTTFIQNGMGVIFGLFGENEECYGALGALKVPDLNSGTLIAAETFWFAEESHRGKGVFLMKEFEKWAKSNGCKKIAMSYMVDSMPMKVKSIYEKFGYKQAEVSYVKEVY